MSTTYTMQSKAGELYKRVETATLDESIASLDDFIIKKDGLGVVQGEYGFSHNSKRINDLIRLEKNTVNVTFIPMDSELEETDMVLLLESHFGDPTKREGNSLVYRIITGIQKRLDGQPEEYFIKTLNIDARKPKTKILNGCPNKKD